MDNTSNKNDEIDLRLVYNKIKQIFMGFWNFIIDILTNIYKVIRKRLLLCIMISILGIGVGIGLFFVQKPIYVSVMTLSSSVLNNDFCEDLILGLQTIVEDDTPELLAQRLNITVQSAKEIKKIQFHNYSEKLKKKYTEKDTVVLGLPFVIKADVYNPTVFDTLQKALVNYLENNNYSLKRKEIAKQNNIAMRGKIINEIRDLDSLKFIIASNMAHRGKENGFVFGQPLDPINTFREGIGLFKEELNLNTALILSDNIQVIEDFAPKAKPDSPRLLRNIVYYGAGGFLLGLIISFYLERKNLLVRA